MGVGFLGGLSFCDSKRPSQLKLLNATSAYICDDGQSCRM